MSGYVGIDVHRKRSQLAVVDQAGLLLVNRQVTRVTTCSPKAESLCPESATAPRAHPPASCRLPGREITAGRARKIA